VSQVTTLLFTGGGGAGNEAIHRVWRGRYELHFADADRMSFSPSLPRDHCHVLPRATEPGFVEALASVCQRVSADIVVPGVDEELPLIPLVRQRLPELKIFAPEPEYVSTMLDKASAMTRLKASGIDVPRTIALDRAADLGFPCFAKPRRGRGSRGALVIEDATAAAAYLHFHGRKAEDIVAQELLQGQEYTVIMAADLQRRLHAIVPVRVDLKRGITLRAETDMQETVIRTCTAIHRAFPASACYNIQLILTRDGRARPFEVNPRVSTTFCLAIASGIDPVEIFLNNREPSGLHQFRAGMSLRRHWHNHIS